MTTNRARWTGVLLGAAVVLAGCGGAASSGGTTTTVATASTAGGAPANPVLDAYQRTLAARTASISLDVTVTGTPSGPTTVDASGQVDFTTGDAAFQMSLPSIGSLGVRLVKPTIYMQFPASAGVPLPAGKSWVSINLDSPAVSSALGASFSQLTDSADESTQGLAYLQGVSADGVTTVGPATVRGVATTEYSATIDLTKAAQGRSAAVQALLQKLQAKTGMTTLPVSVWIDAQGQIRREVLDESLTTNGVATGATVTIEYFDFGAPVDVTPPPASQTVDISSMLGSALGAGTGA